MESAPTWKAEALNTRMAVRGNASSVTWDPTRLMVCPAHIRTKSGCRHKVERSRGGAPG